jgi:3-hydroxypropanoate dehydrogenase
MAIVDDAALDIIFRNARTHRAFTAEPVSDELLHQIYDLAKLGPTSANSSPARIVFVRSPEAKERLKPALSPGNVEKTMSAPVTAIFAYDLQFYELFPRLAPFMKDAVATFASNPAMAEQTAKMNAALQGAYFMLAARSLGVDCGPMAGFDNAKVDAEFFAGTSWRSSFLCNLGHGDASKLHPRGPRLDFDEVCKIL